MQLPKSLSRLGALGAGSPQERWERHLPLAVAALLTVVIAWQAVQLGYRFMGAAPASSSSALAPGVVAQAAAPVADLQAIVNAHLFGVAGAAGSGAGDPSNAPATRMPLVLVGVIAQPDPNGGLAIIGESASTAKVYTVGRTISGGTKLHSVYADRVIIDRGGQLEALALPKQFKGGGAAPLAAASTVADPGIGDRLRALSAQNPAAITEIIRPQPVFANGQQRGFRVYPGRNRQQFSRLGLMPGDLVTAVNGTPLDDPARGMEIFQSINSAAEANITIERNGQTQQLTINNTQLPTETQPMPADEPVR